MKPLLNQENQFDLLNGSFVSIPYAWLARFSTLDLSHKEFTVLLQILGSIQVSGDEILSPHEIGLMCRVSEREAGEILDGLVKRGFLAIGESSDATGNRVIHFSLHPLWQQLQQRPETKQAPAPTAERKLLTLFEQEFGRPLSGLECEQVRQWLIDGYADWMLVEALREAVLANKCSFRYMDRILYDWQRKNIQSHQDLELYRQSYRARAQAREETAATSSTTRRSNSTRPPTKKTQPNANASVRDERYSAFYDLFPDA